MTIDRAGWPFVAMALVPAAVLAWVWPWAGLVLVVPAVAVALFFRDPDRTPPRGDVAVAPADGRVMHAGMARPAEAPDGEWLQVTIFLSLFDVHINRSPVSGRIMRVERHDGGFVAAFKPESYGNTRTEIWFDHGGTWVVARQVVGLLARRIVCRVRPGDEVAAGARIGLMKFGSRMDVFLPPSATLSVAPGMQVRAGETVIATLAGKAR